jgi:D-glycero-D-manno-heptose 1,7-bisphosphate phosphatase
LDSISKVKIISNVVGLLKYLQYNNYKLFIITNQSGIARGYFDEKFVIESNNYLQELFAKQNIFFERTYFCPHLPEKNRIDSARNNEAFIRIKSDECTITSKQYLHKGLNVQATAKTDKYLVNCTCRKPQPGLILQAAKDFNINLSESLMFGDKISDIEAGKLAGCKSFYIQHFFENHGLFPDRVLKKLMTEFY